MPHESLAACLHVTLCLPNAPSQFAERLRVERAAREAREAAARAAAPPPLRDDRYPRMDPDPRRQGDRMRDMIASMRQTHPMYSSTMEYGEMMRMREERHAAVAEVTAQRALAGSADAAVTSARMTSLDHDRVRLERSRERERLREMDRGRRMRFLELTRPLPEAQQRGSGIPPPRPAGTAEIPPPPPFLSATVEGGDEGPRPLPPRRSFRDLHPSAVAHIAAINGPRDRAEDAPPPPPPVNDSAAAAAAQASAVERASSRIRSSRARPRPSDDRLLDMWEMDYEEDRTLASLLRDDPDPSSAAGEGGRARESWREMGRTIADLRQLAEPGRLLPRPDPQPRLPVQPQGDQPTAVVQMIPAALPPPQTLRDRQTIQFRSHYTAPVPAPAPTAEGGLDNQVFDDFMFDGMVDDLARTSSRPPSRPPSTFSEWRHPGVGAPPPAGPLAEAPPAGDPAARPPHPPSRQILPWDLPHELQLGFGQEDMEWQRHLDYPAIADDFDLMFGGGTEPGSGGDGGGGGGGGGARRSRRWFAPERAAQPRAELLNGRASELPELLPRWNFPTQLDDVPCVTVAARIASPLSTDDDDELSLAQVAAMHVPPDRDGGTPEPPSARHPPPPAGRRRGRLPHHAAAVLRSAVPVPPVAGNDDDGGVTATTAAGNAAEDGVRLPTAVYYSRQTASSSPPAAEEPMPASGVRDYPRIRLRRVARESRVETER